MQTWAGVSDKVAERQCWGLVVVESGAMGAIVAIDTSIGTFGRYYDNWMKLFRFLFNFLLSNIKKLTEVVDKFFFLPMCLLNMNGNWDCYFLSTWRGFGIGGHAILIDKKNSLITIYLFMENANMHPRMKT